MDNDTKVDVRNVIFVMSELQVTSNPKVSVSMIKKPKTDPIACTGDIMAMLDTLDVLGGRWKLLIVHYLILRQGQANTFKKMEKDIEGISAKMLSKELKSLEANLIVNRTVMNTKPVTIQYSITPYGLEAKEVITTLLNWGQKHRVKLFEIEVE
jgi:DNA-binding HxlR family transcriptional regulator